MRVAYFSLSLVAAILRMTEDEVYQFVANKQLNKPSKMLDSDYWSEYDIYTFKGLGAVEAKRQRHLPGRVYLHVRDVAALYAVKEATVRNWVHANKFPKPDVISSTGIFAAKTFSWRQSLVQKFRSSNDQK